MFQTIVKLVAGSLLNCTDGPVGIVTARVYLSSKSSLFAFHFLNFHLFAFKIIFSFVFCPLQTLNGQI